MSAPEWAIKAASERMGLRHDSFKQRCYGPGFEGAINSLATYIAKHEEEPFDPLILEARELTAQYFEVDECNLIADEYRTGAFDDEACDISQRLGFAYAALKRGMELGQEQSS